MRNQTLGSCEAHNQKKKKTCHYNFFETKLKTRSLEYEVWNAQVQSVKMRLMICSP
jgi:hypothetical protein